MGTEVEEIVQNVFYNIELCIPHLQYYTENTIDYIFTYSIGILWELNETMFIKPLLNGWYLL